MEIKCFLRAIMYFCLQQDKAKFNNGGKGSRISKERQVYQRTISARCAAKFSQRHTVWGGTCKYIRDNIDTNVLSAEKGLMRKQTMILIWEVMKVYCFNVNIVVKLLRKRNHFKVIRRSTLVSTSSRANIARRDSTEGTGMSYIYKHISNTLKWFYFE